MYDFLSLRQIDRELHKYYACKMEDSTSKPISIILEAIRAFYCFGIKYYQVPHLTVGVKVDHKGVSIFLSKAGGFESFERADSKDSMPTEEIIPFFNGIEQTLKKCTTLPSKKQGAHKKTKALKPPKEGNNTPLQQQILFYKVSMLVDQADLVRLMLFAKRKLMSVGGMCQISMDQVQIGCPKKLL